MTESPVNPDHVSRPSGRTGGFALPRLARAIVEVYPRLLGALLLLTAAQKAWDETGLVRVLEFDRIPEPLIRPMVSLVIITETAVGLMLILRPKLRAVLGVAVALLSIYTLQLAYLAASRDAPNCVCIAAWRAYHSARFGNLMGIGRNVCLIVALMWVRAQVRNGAAVTGTTSTSPASS